MPKIEAEKVVEIVKRRVVEPAIAREIIEELNLAMQPEEDKEPKPHEPKQYIILVSDPDNKMPVGLELVGWVLQIPEDAPVTSAAERIHIAAYEFNTTKKGRMMPAKTIGDAIENLPAKLLTEHRIWVKTKTPVFVQRTNNIIPDETLE